MSSFVDDTSSLTSLRTTEPANEPSPNPGEAAGAPPPGGKRKREKTSWIWAHGEEVDVDGAPYWQCSHCSSEPKPKRYKVSAGTHSPAIHLKEKHGVEEDISRKAKRLEVQKSNVEQAAEAAQLMQKRQAVGLPETAGEGSHAWNADTHKQLLVFLEAPVTVGPCIASLCSADRRHA
jgi:hypothetical protein